MGIQKVLKNSDRFPPQLLQISDCPDQIYTLGNLELLSAPNNRLAVVGSRAATTYGKTITTQLAERAARLGVIIISGLAFGVDSLAHRAALQAAGKTIAVMPCGLDSVYPRSHRGLAKQILQSGGLLVSEYPKNTPPHKHNFIARNRLISALSEAVLIPEAAEKSGSLHTAQFALEQGRDVMAVPGDINRPLSAGTNNLIKSGAMVVTEPQDIINYFGLQEPNQQQALVGSNQEEQTILDLVRQGINDGSELLEQSGLEVAVFNQTLTMLEITGQVKPQGSNQWSLS